MFRKKLKLYQIILSDGVPLKKNIYEYEINYLCMIAIYFVVAEIFYAENPKFGLLPFVLYVRKSLCPFRICLDA